MVIVEPRGGTIDTYYMMNEHGPDVNAKKIIKFYNDYTEGKAEKAY